MDWNNDGKIDVRDAVLYHEMSNNQAKETVTTFSGGSNVERYRTIWEKNPYITESIARGRINVLLQKGPEGFQKYIKQRYALQLMIDHIRKKLLIVYGQTNIIHEIDFDNIASAVCLDANQRKENRYRVQIITKSGEIFFFHVDIPYHNDLNPFLASLNYQIDCYLHPEAHKHDALYGTIALAVIVAAVLLIILL